jgi:hypothetical protein
VTALTAAMPLLVDGAGAARLPDPRAWQAILHTAATAALRAVAQLAAERQQPVGEFASTLILAAATPDVAAVLQIGDGAAVAEVSADSYAALTRPEPCEYANETRFLTSPDALERCQFGAFEGPVTGIVLLTDGVQRLALRMPSGEPHSPLFARLLRFVRHTDDAATGEARLVQLLRSGKVTERTDDDLTLLLAVPLCRPQEGSAPAQDGPG